jgi:hypothetical protein
MKWSPEQLVPLVESFVKYKRASDILHTPNVQVRFNSNCGYEAEYRLTDLDPWKPLITLGTVACPLCNLFYYTDSPDNILCVKCPIRIITGRAGCSGTPYHICENMFNVYSKLYILNDEELEKFRNAIKAEADFLESVLMAKEDTTSKLIKTQDNLDTRDDSDIEEFIGLLQDRSHNNSVKIERVMTDRIMYIKLPTANSTWTFDIFQATEKFVRSKSSERCWLEFDEEIARAGYISIRLP